MDSTFLIRTRTATSKPSRKIGERTGLWREIINVKHCKNRRQMFVSGLITFHFILMSSLKAAMNHLLISRYEEVINDEECLLLYDINKS